MIIYDSFQGLPVDEDKISTRYYPHLKVTGKYDAGMYKGSKEEVITNLKNFGEYEACILREGFFKESMKTHKEKIDFLFLDVDFAQTAPSGHSNGYIKTVGSSTYSVYQGNTDTNGVNGSSDDMIAYCFAEKQGYSKIGSYVGNGNADGTFVYTGFKPAWIMTKRTDASSQAWNIQDNKRSPINVQDNFIQTDSDAEASAGGTGIWDSLSNGFKLRQNLQSTNNSGSNYIYMAFAESPFVSSKGVPTTAR